MHQHLPDLLLLLCWLVLGADRQRVAALAPTRGEHVASGLCGHSLHEAVFLLALQASWLVSPLRHVPSPSRPTMTIDERSSGPTSVQVCLSACQYLLACAGPTAIVANSLPNSQLPSAPVVPGGVRGLRLSSFILPSARPTCEKCVSGDDQTTAVSFRLAALVAACNAAIQTPGRAS